MRKVHFTEWDSRLALQGPGAQGAGVPPAGTPNPRQASSYVPDQSLIAFRAPITLPQCRAVPWQGRATAVPLSPVGRPFPATTWMDLRHHAEPKKSDTKRTFAIPFTSSSTTGKADLRWKKSEQRLTLAGGHEEGLRKPSGMMEMCHLNCRHLAVPTCQNSSCTLKTRAFTEPMLYLKRKHPPQINPQSKRAPRFCGLCVTHCAHAPHSWTCASDPPIPEFLSCRPATPILGATGTRG